MSAMHRASDPVTPLRLQLLANGWRPVPVTGPKMRCPHPGKQPLMKNWQKVCADADEAEVRRWGTAQPSCTNTGLLCGLAVGADLDVPVVELAERIEALAAVHLGRTRLRRVGRAPKLLLAYRTATPLPKMETPELFLLDGTKTQVEILGTGNQFVAYGVHPDTGREYEWPDLGPDVVPLGDLPVVTEEMLRAFIGAAETMLREAGGLTDKERRAAAAPAADASAEPERTSTTSSTAKPTSTQRSGAGGTSFFRQVNAAALADLNTWVQRIFPKAQRQDTGAWRVTSADLGRGYEEDLSLHPAGIQDFGPRKGLSPCDVVMEFAGAATLQDAAFTLCEWLGRQPAEFGWKTARSARKSAAAGAHQDGDAEAAEWAQYLQRDDRGDAIPNLANAMTAMRSAPELRGSFAYDEMLRTSVLMKPVPGGRGTDLPRPIKDGDVGQVQEWLQRHEMRRIGKDTVHQAVDLRAEEQRFHPVRDYLNGLHWDEEPRLRSWLHTYLGAAWTAETKDYVAKVGTMFLISMVARVMRPGAKVDYMLILEGPQAALKSTTGAILGDKWFSDSLPDIGTDAVRLSQHLRGKWLIEIGELSAMGRAETEELKAFLTRREEQFTPKYGRREVTEPRQCVFMGTTNKAAYLRDETGARRFWPVKVGTVDADALARDRDQLFAEAVHMFQQGEAWWPDRDDEEQFFKPQQANRFEADAWQEPISTMRPSSSWVTIMQVARDALGIEAARLGTIDQRRITTALERAGWVRGSIVNGVQRWIQAGE
jgi:predicted P-loop ATPase